MKVINDLVGYNNLKIVQDTEWFSFSLDSVLLPNFVTILPACKKILDLGTGNAPIPMILQTKTDAEIYSIEIQKEIYDLAKESLEINKLESRIKLINDDMKNLDKYFESDSFDLIITNPPYFKVNEESRKNKTEQKSIARHEIHIKLEEILQISKKYLKNGGTFAMVNRTERLIEIIEVFRKNNIEPKKIRLVYPKIDAESNMILIEGRKNAKSGIKFLPPLFVHNNNGDYTEEVLKYFSD